MKLKRKRRKSINVLTTGRKNKQTAEQFRTIRSNINFASRNSEIRSIAVCSSNSGDGKTMTATNLAIVFSQGGKKVLLVDADMRKPEIHHMFELPNFYGLSNYLIGQKRLEDIITKTYISDLDIVTSGIIPPNPAELLGSIEMEQFNLQVESLYDVVIYDTPPVLAVTDATLIANQCDGTLLVVRYKKTELKDVENVKVQLSMAGANLIGALLNGKKLPKVPYYY